MKGRIAAKAIRQRSAMIMRRIRGRRSASTPATGASSRTGRISAMTTLATPSPEPLSWNTSTTSAMVFTVSPQREMVWAANSCR